jgi:hypothetical protein
MLIATMFFEVLSPTPFPGHFPPFFLSPLQVLAMSVATMFFAVLGFLSPANRGALMTALLLLFVLMGVLAGFVSARLYKAMAGSDWRMTTLKTALMFPGEHRGRQIQARENERASREPDDTARRVGWREQQHAPWKRRWH